ncbi:MAG: hypothetical protein OEZ22_15095 [Spirochaetia bacterium]|nr:hypothetical protein [Spirochaetia bacterium]
MKYVVGIFFILHGLVHLLYSAHSLKRIELEKNFIWPDNSWLFSNKLNIEFIKQIASIACVIVAIGFVIGGILVFIEFSWSYWEIIASAIISSIIFFIFWDGSIRKIHSQGAIAILINIAIIIIVLYLNNTKE